MARTKDKSEIRREFARYAIPSVAGMVVSSLYTVVDGIFVGRGVGDLALGGVNIVFPFIMLVIALTMLIAIGGANLAAFLRGRGRQAEANNIFCQSACLLLAAGAMLFVGAWFFSREICLLLGADADLLPYAESYLRSMAPFVAVQTVGLGLSVFVRNDNAPNLVMIGTISGAVANIFLDYLFIMVFQWGIEGAAFATGLGLTLELAVYLSHFARARGALRFRMPIFSAREIARLAYNGFSSFLMEFCQSAIAVSFNLVIIRHLGPLGVAAYGVVTYICSSFNMILIGITQGAQPILSFNHGRGDVEAVKTIYAMGSKTSIAVSIAFVITCFLGGRQLSGMFSDGGGELVELSTRMLSYFCVAYIPVGLTLMNILFFQTTEREGRGALVSVLRCVGFVLAFLLVLPRWWGEYGIYLSFFFGEAANWLVSAILYAGIEEPESSMEPQPAYAPIIVSPSPSAASARLRSISGRQ